MSLLLLGIFPSLLQLSKGRMFGISATRLIRCNSNSLVHLVDVRLSRSTGHRRTGRWIVGNACSPYAVLIATVCMICNFRPVEDGKRGEQIRSNGVAEDQDRRVDYLMCTPSLPPTRLGSSAVLAGKVEETP